MFPKEGKMEAKNVEKKYRYMKKEEGKPAILSTHEF